MKKSIIATLILAATGTAALADNSLTSKAMSDLISRSPSGLTGNPTAKPNSGSLSDKAMNDLPALRGAGRTANPTAKPDTGSLSAGSFVKGTNIN